MYREAKSIFLSAMIALLPGAAQAGEVLVFAAASLKEALTEAVDGWRATSGVKVAISFAGSSTLARQIQAGAPADLFLSANADWVDVLENEGLVREGSRTDLLTNSLVVIAHDPSTAPVDFTARSGLADRLGDGRLAMALVEAVPAGIYGKAALEALGWWEAIAPRIAQADNVRAALALVATGEAPLGIVYATDALAEPRVTMIGRFPADTHPPIHYPMVIPSDSTSPEAPALAAHLAGPEAAEVFRRHGFGLPESGD